MNRFQNMADDQIITAYQKECGNAGWGSARATYLAELRTEMKKRFECSEIITEDGGLLLGPATVQLSDGKVLRHKKD